MHGREKKKLCSFRAFFAWFVFVLKTVLYAKTVINFSQLDNNFQRNFSPHKFKNQNSQTKASYVLPFSKEICFMFIKKNSREGGLGGIRKGLMIWCSHEKYNKINYTIKWSISKTNTWFRWNVDNRRRNEWKRKTLENDEAITTRTIK